MPEFYKDSEGNDSWFIMEARQIVTKLNTVYAKFGVKYRVERSSMTKARVLKETTEGGQQHKVKKLRRKKC